MTEVASTRHTPPIHDTPATSQVFGLVTLVAILVYVGALPWTIANGTYDLWGGLLLAPILVMLSLPILRRIARSDGDPWLLNLLSAALMIKLLGALIRYLVTFSVLGPADANEYHRAGADLAREFRAWKFAGPAFQEHVPDFVGTPFIRLLTGIFYTVTGPTKLGGFVLFSWLGFWGLVLCYRAVRIGVPKGNHRLYAVLVFFLPSLVFWPSSIGKEAWMQLAIGLCLYGAARILAHQRGGFVLLVLGLTATGMVRPHISLIVFFALCVAYLLRPSRQRDEGPAPPTKLLGILVLVLIGAVLIGRTQSFFELDSSGASAVDEVLTQVEEQSEQGGSEFDSVRPTSPVEFPFAVVTVLFRPFPFEAGSVTAMIASLEGMVVLVLFIRVFRRLLLVPRIPYAAFAATFTVLFIFAFSAFSNFGILVRQRTQVLPLVLVLVALPVASADRPPPVARTSLGRSRRGLRQSPRTRRLP